MLRNKVETKSIFLNLLHIKKGWTSKTICVNSADTNENHYYLLFIHKPSSTKQAEKLSQRSCCHQNTHQYQETAADSIDDPVVFFDPVEG